MINTKIEIKITIMLWQLNLNKLQGHIVVY